MDTGGDAVLQGHVPGEGGEESCIENVARANRVGNGYHRRIGCHQLIVRTDGQGAVRSAFDHDDGVFRHQRLQRVRRVCGLDPVGKPRRFHLVEQGAVTARQPLTCCRTVGFAPAAGWPAGVERDADIVGIGPVEQRVVIRNQRIGQERAAQEDIAATQPVRVQHRQDIRPGKRAELKRLHLMLGTTIVYVTHDQIEAMTLATRIAVMRDGQIEQLATPDEIYNRPATRYVASFVGSPPMNMLEATVAEGIAHIDGSLSGFALPGDIREKAGQARDVIIGIRPESLSLAPAGDAALGIDAMVEVVELTGPELVVTSTIGSQRLTASLPPKSAVTAGMAQRFAIDAGALHIFDKATGKRL